MTAIADHSPVGSLVRRFRDPAAWMAAADVSAVLLAAALPWSTSLVAIFAVVMLIALGPFLDLEALWRCVKRPIAAVPIAFFLLALVGTLWSPAPWGRLLPERCASRSADPASRPARPAGRPSARLSR